MEREATAAWQLKFHLGKATLFFNKKISAGYNICTLLLSVAFVCNIC
jgi:hypothetical protein